MWEGCLKTMKGPSTFTSMTVRHHRRDIPRRALGPSTAVLFTTASIGLCSATASCIQACTAGASVTLNARRKRFVPSMLVMEQLTGADRESGAIPEADVAKARPMPRLPPVSRMCKRISPALLSNCGSQPTDFAARKLLMTPFELHGVACSPRCGKALGALVCALIDRSAYFLNRATQGGAVLTVTSPTLERLAVTF